MPEQVQLIHKRFLSKDATTLTKAFGNVRPILEYASVIWLPYHLGEIAKLESVRLRNMTYADRIIFLKLASLEVRRLRFDVIFTYKILFGLLFLNSQFVICIWCIFLHCQHH